MIHTTLQLMLADIEQHKETDKNALLQKYVQERLEQSLRTYYKELLDSYNVLTHHDEQNVLAQLVRR